jgi:predicted O-methyltransferase YrrM
MTVKALVKSGFKKLPLIRRLISQRQQLVDELQRVQDERELLSRDNTSLIAERENIDQRLQATACERDYLDQCLQATSSERDHLDQRLQESTAEHANLLNSCGFVPPGHFYSPIPSLEEVRRDDSRIFAAPPRTIPGVNLRESEQLQLLSELARYYSTVPFQKNKTVGLRYHYENDAYSYSDAIFLHCMIRHLNPSKIIEVGSGFSSCVMLDTNEHFFEGRIQTTFIEPYPNLVNSLLTDSDRPQVKLIPQRLQDVPIEEFKSLGPNDILFIDSTHVGKVNSDVNRIFFEILPVLSSGVCIHFHDIFYPFEYPRHWVHGGRAWNEIYMLRSFLQYNDSFRIMIMNTFLEHFHEQFFRDHMPLCLKNRGGSIWLQKQ